MGQTNRVVKGVSGVGYQHIQGYLAAADRHHVLAEGDMRHAVAVVGDERQVGTRLERKEKNT